MVFPRGGSNLCFSHKKYQCKKYEQCGKLNRLCGYTLQKLAHAINRDFFSLKNLKCLTEKNLILPCEAVLTSTHNLCFGAKIRKIDIPLHTPLFTI